MSTRTKPVAYWITTVLVAFAMFSGGIGEHAAPVRTDICAGLAYLGIALDSGANGRNDNVISRSGSHCMVRVVPSDEDMQIARHCVRLVL